MKTRLNPILSWRNRAESFVLYLIPVLCTSSVSSQPFLAIGSIPSYPGTMVQLPVSLRTGSNVSAIQFDVEYAPGRSSLADPLLAGRFTNHIIRSREIAPGVRRVLVYSPISAESISNRTAVARLPVALPSQEYSGSGPLRPLNAVLVDGNGVRLSPVTTSGGSVFTSSVYRREDGIVEFFQPSVPDERYLIQATTNFLDWVNLSTNVAIGTFMDLVDLDGLFFQYRYYRSFEFDKVERGLISAFERQRGGPAILRFIGLEGNRYSVEASTDLRGWTSLTTNLVGSRTLEFVDATAGQYSQRFYRLRRN